MLWLFLLWPVLGFAAGWTDVALMNTWTVDYQWRNIIAYIMIFIFFPILGPTGWGFVISEWRHNHNGQGFSSCGLTRPYPWLLRWLPVKPPGYYVKAETLQPNLSRPPFNSTLCLTTLRQLYHVENPANDLPSSTTT